MRSPNNGYQEIIHSENHHFPMSFFKRTSQNASVKGGQPVSVSAPPIMMLILQEDSFPLFSSLLLFFLFSYSPTLSFPPPPVPSLNRLSSILSSPIFTSSLPPFRVALTNLIYPVLVVFFSTCSPFPFHFRLLRLSIRKSFI
ncbi:hypothetical protein AO1008_01942 [Aspergillus oryzae 100-8]|uniref:Transmembrane protein n=1 Tax=Aspergillus oryzae (strain 3.042) TaxID=1160506 RepID=I8TYN9_ASPO3|nr:hypothetical protein Ao3042_04145 [Aspergillus oryzae 3.042]KDE76191.1 hypothetical protein AO1008_01942 [Aspergillus oryzae 100-8]|eukprot:EIT79403.1 hypothetical protein Ao3042_04145 [Aspergillus oryzae 3.042]